MSCILLDRFGIDDEPRIFSSYYEKLLFFLNSENVNEKEKEPADKVTNKTGESID